MNKKLAIILAIYILLRIPVLIGNYFGMECAYILELSRRPWAEIISNSMANTFSPSYFAVLKYWGLVSQHDAWITLYCVIVGALIVWALYAAGREFFSEAAGMAAAAMFAVSPYALFMATEIRYHNLYALFSLLNMICMARVVRDGPTIRRLFDYAVSAILLLYTFHFAVFLIAFQQVYMLWRRRFGARWIITNAIAAAAYAPWIFVTAAQARHRGIGVVSAGSVFSYIFRERSFLNLADILAALTGGSTILAHADDIASRFIFLGSLALLAAAAFFALRARKPGNDYFQFNLLFGLAVVIPLLLSYVFHAATRSMFFTRFHVNYVPLIFLAVAAAVAGVRSKFVRLAAYALFFSIALLSSARTFREIFRPNPVPAAVAHMVQSARPGEPVLAAPLYNTPVLMHYAGRRLKIMGVPHDFNIARDAFDYEIKSDRDMAATDARIAGAPSFWVFYETEGIERFDRKRVFRDWLAERCIVLRDTPFRNGPFSLKQSHLLHCMNRRPKPDSAFVYKPE